MESLTIEGYASELSYVAGESVTLCCSTNARQFSVEIARVGGTREIVWSDNAVEGVLQPTPERASEHGCGWSASVQLTVPEHWRSGYYEVVLRAVDEETGRSEESLAFFVVRHSGSAHPKAPILLVLSTNTYNAYNDWGGPSLYTGAVRASFQRPMARGFLRKPEPYLRYPNLDDVHDPEHERFRAWADLHGLARWSGSSGWYQWERLFVQWAERAGYTIDVAVNADLERHPEVVDGYPMLVSVGHDEYWSWGMRDTAESFVERGGNIAFLSGNSVCWQVRFEDDGHTMLSYKADPEADPLYGTDSAAPRLDIVVLADRRTAGEPSHRTELLARRIRADGERGAPSLRRVYRLATRPLGLCRNRRALRGPVRREGLDRGLRGGRLRVHPRERRWAAGTHGTRWHPEGFHHPGDCARPALGL